MTTQENTPIGYKLIAGLLLMFLSGLIIMLMWNISIADIFPKIIPKIGYIQACALGLLGRSLTTRIDI